jgi:hypothetical protein
MGIPSSLEVILIKTDKAMNVNFPSSRTLFAAASLLIAANLQAATPTVTAAVQAAANPPLVNLGVSSEVGYLQQVYATLATADHDYKGHRVKAMKAIETACKLLGSGIGGDGKGHEKQALSDAQLREAIGMLQNASGIVAAQGQKKVLTHIDTAIKELNIALTIH